jgi:hypothetical protein
VNVKNDRQVQEFLVNDDFINYVVCPNLILIELWKDFFENHPELILAAEEAKNILLGESQFVEMDINERHQLKHSILMNCGFTSID